MPATEFLCNSVGISCHKLTKTELLFLEAKLLTCICDELKEFLRNKYRSYFILMKFTIQMEDTMLENDFIRFLIEDILSSEEYNLQGIACYTDIHEDIIQEIITGQNMSPPAKLLRRIIVLHKSVRRDLYSNIIKKIAAEHIIAV